MATEIQRIVLQGIEAGLAVSQEELVDSMQLPEGSDADDVATANEMARQDGNRQPQSGLLRSAY